uniref:Ldh_1_C domain-containing protein n=1 Tax=Globodera pallida TaxID=36090 RepID=A0A183CLJ4_GLOPA
MLVKCCGWWHSRHAFYILFFFLSLSDHIHDWHFGTPSGQWVSMAVPSDGSYGIPEGLIFSFPVNIDAQSREWKIVQGLDLDDFAKQKIDITTKELLAERDEALEACNVVPDKLSAIKVFSHL